MRKYGLFISFLLSLLLLSGCGGKLPITVSGDGDITSETRALSSFNGVEFAGDYQVTLVSGKSQQVVITADKNLLPYIASTVKKEGLSIGPQEGATLKPSKPIKITISGPQIAAIGIIGNSDVEATNLNNPNTILLIKGNGKITVSGQSQSAAIHISGNGEVDAKDLQLNKANVVVKGGNAVISVSDKLSVVNEGGKITYFGSPELKQITKGGEVIKG